ncbi:MAG: endonuclease III [Prevotellaceae bacterium]|nr:endonuclease III [Candidatus Colivivens caballi]
MTTKERYTRLVEFFSATMPDAQTELNYDSPFHLLMAVMLSAQCTDKRVNLVTPQLFAAYPTPESLAAATEEEVLQHIHSVSYPNSKAQHLIGMARMLSSDYNSIVPDSREELMRLPGVGRKTANVVLSVYMGQSVMAVDTHVFRVSHRIGLVPASATTPLAVEQHLCRHLSEDVIPHAHHWLILHGRYVCRAVKPLCSECQLKDICKDFARRNA